jgi:hypothetical protein
MQTGIFQTALINNVAVQRIEGTSFLNYSSGNESKFVAGENISFLTTRLSR